MKIYFYLFLHFSTTICCGQDLKCADFKTGNFRYENPIFSDWIVQRTEKIQIEINLNDGTEVHSYIDWTSDCAYTLTLKKILNTTVKGMQGKELFVTIIKINGNKMKYLCKFGSEEYSDEMIKILDN